MSCGRRSTKSRNLGLAGTNNQGDEHPEICDTDGMRFIAPLLGRLLFCLGLMITVVGCVIGSMIGSTGGATMSGMPLMILGGAIYWFGTTKVCSHCTKRIKHTERACKYCGGAQD